MEMHPLLFAVIAYGTAIIIALCVAFIIKIIALIVRREGKGNATANAKKDG
jgi:uncharacterized membrane protein